MSGVTVVQAGIRRRDVTLADRYLLPDGEVFLTGVQALVRLLLDQHRADVRDGLRTATLVSGYQGSPLGGFDKEVGGLGPLAAEHELVLRPGVNEELGATAVWGSQLAGTLPGPRYDGVLGVWYGKSPGVDRSADAIRHGNFVGTDPRGGVLALCGDDPACKSSTIPGASESLLAALHVPVFAPGSVQEVLDLGRHAIACSRASGLWSALKVVTNVADAAATATVGLGRVTPVVPVVEHDGVPYVHRPSAHLLAPESLELEQTLVTVRLELAKRYARLNDLNRVVIDHPAARVGIVAAGATLHDVRRALTDLGLDDDAPVRLLHVGMPYPLDDEGVRAFAAGLDEIVVVEEKGPFLERLVKEALYGGPATPPVTGARDDRGAPLLPAHGTLDADAIAVALGSRLLAHGAGEPERIRARLDGLVAVAARPAAQLGARRMPFFCSGCPHSASTAAPEDAVVGAGIGCHTMVMLNPSGRGRVTGITQMGGEGVQWIGAAPFTARRHYVQNLGDGTFHHSGSLAVRAAVAARLDVTYKLLCNGTVAMTGGQHVEGQMDVEAIVASLLAEGVSRIVVTADDVARYDRVTLPAGVEVRGREALMETQRELARVPGVTVLIHDQACAAELRRARKRGRAPDPPQRVVINERVCEGCGDCGEKSGCLSVEPVETELGRKTRVNQTSCNKDFSCLEGDCPSFLTVVGPRERPASRAERAAPRAAPRLPQVELPPPAPCAADDVRIRLVGIGGTGVVTVSQVLGMAALLDGRHASGLDQTGLSQKAGPVTSDVRVTRAPVADGVTVPSASLDVLLGLDLLGAAAPGTLRAARTEATVAIVSDSVVPTGAMVTDPDAAAPDIGAARAAIDAVTRAERNVYLDAQRIAETLLGDVTPANVVVLGAAVQRGALPLSLDAVEQAFRLNGAGVERNLAALAWGRAAVAAPEHVAAALAESDAPPAAPLSPRAVALVARAGGEEPKLRRLLELRVPDLLAWGGARPAERYADVVARVRAAESERLPGSTALTEAVVRGLHKLVAYKDEYEVARLHLDGLALLPRGSRVTFHLHPPLLRALGMRRKLRLGGWFVPVLRVMRHGRRLRGTPLDPFGYAHVRRVERALPGEYLTLVEDALARLSPATLPTAVAVAELPDLVRGYEQIKLDGVARFRARAAELGATLESNGEDPS
ncbi:indolepyruvate ferredoxin oxidoreductase family protein [Conexibacter woesei]|uniref:Indolepyruvate ferredoxin oxidoreductase n=1 Tax=Conexibacter woesei (strain DSM 14684 / CCUG 47730 / CIP 108061 / JCM 11494 / NBRC 100937 / ID131577) TaxID=469383 RepID=D3F0T1_CONWI|nr:indolepyruvate ferredoxin oxidoreductase family protein [Conexibacter woesei]ADB54015.1 Indolepyruvate ferredoxin oxidoreductase [Conexibacter woesei DSM 14684]